MDFNAMIEGFLDGTAPEFRPRAHYIQPMDLLVIYLKDRPYVASVFTRELDLLLDAETREIVGVQVHGAGRLIDDERLRRALG